MTFPSLQPSSRSFDPGAPAIKTYNAQSGAEVRLKYGSQRTKMKLALSYKNITDSNAESFLTHYDSVEGTFSTFTIPSAAFSGWAGSSSALDATGANAWRYEQPPQISSVRPGVSTVTVNLVGVL